VLPSLRSLEALSQLWKLGSLTAAAETLGVTRSALSHRIAELEDQLGVALVERSGRRLRLTDEAETLLVSMGDAIERIRFAVAPLNRRSQLRISTVHTFASLWLLPRLPRFAARHPNIEIALSTTRRVVNLDTESVDCAIRHGTGSWPGLVSTLILRESLVPVAAPAIQSSLRKAHLIRARSRFRDWSLWQRETGQTVAAGTAGLIVESGAQALDAALAGAGVALLNQAYVAEHVARGRLQILGPAVNLTEGYYLVHRPEKVDRRLIRAFRDWIAEEVRSV
jgi:DNA-binding transcriptional LysR family regulator